MNKIIVRTRLHTVINRMVGLFEPEIGGMLIGKNGRILTYYFDRVNSVKGPEYVPHTDTMNEAISNCQERGLEFMGIVHSHAPENAGISINDIEYARKILQATNTPDVLYYITINVQADETTEWECHRITEDTIEQMEIVLVEINYKKVHTRN